jgi:golgi phosphoprotein 3
MFNIYEELFLISIDDESGEVSSPAAYSIQYGLAGAILADLALYKKIELDSEKLVVLDSAPTGDRRLDESLAMIVASHKLRKPSHWINVLAVKKLTRLVAEGLAARGMLQIVDQRYLSIIPYEAYPPYDVSAKYGVKANLRAIVLGGARPVPGAVVLLSLIKACDLLNLVFTRDERKAAARKVDELAHSEIFGKAVAKTLAEIETSAAALALDAAG